MGTLIKHVPCGPGRFDIHFEAVEVDVLMKLWGHRLFIYLDITLFYFKETNEANFHSLN